MDNVPGQELMKWSEVDLSSLAQELLYVQGALLSVVSTTVKLDLRYQSLGELRLVPTQCQLTY